MTQVIMPIAYQFDPDLVLVSAGFDAAVNDPLGGKYLYFYFYFCTGNNAYHVGIDAILAVYYFYHYSTHSRILIII